MGLHKTKKRGQARERSVGIFMMVAGVLPFFLFLFTFIYDWRTALTLPFFPSFFLRYHIVSQHNQATQRVSC